MSRPDDRAPAEPRPDLETDPRFPSGEWTGFFLQPLLPGKHWMELRLTFAKGILKGDGRDRVGEFLFSGRYELESGRCWWTKSYIKKHSIAYQGYNEGKGIWGVWEMEPPWRGGFMIWPVEMGDPTQSTLKAEADAPADADPPITVESTEEVEVGVGVS